METPVRAVVGTAGHVDHGKTTLVRALTGIDTDRLQEEKARGISIELGFAWLDLPVGRLAIVDVPGHERFVRQMIAGAAGIDLVVLVVAADEGVMPQTREHLDICQLLGVRAGGVVLTKTDLVDPDWLDLVEEDVREAVAGTFLADAPVVACARDDANGLARVRAMLAGLVEDATARGLLAARSEDRPFKLSVDRAFTLRGFGTVVTGTTAAGRLAVGDPVRVLPGEVRGRARGLHVHGEPVDRVGPAHRVAVNLQGVELADVHRGQVVAGAEGLAVTAMFDGVFTALARLPGPLPDRTRALVHVGTAQVEGTLAWMGAREVAPGERVAVQVRLDQPVALLPGEPFVARGSTVLPGYGKTLGGGRALLPAFRRHRRRDAAEPALVRTLDGADPRAMVAALVRWEELRGVPRDTLPLWLPAERAALAAATDALLADGELAEADGALYHREVLAALAPDALARVEAAHRERPAWPGVSTEELRSRLGRGVSAGLLAGLVDRLVAEGRLRREGDVVSLPGFAPALSAPQQAAVARVREALLAGGLSPPRRQDLPEEVGLPEEATEEALELLALRGEAVRVSRELYYAAAPLAELQARLVAFLEEHGTIDTGAFKELTGASRKWTIPLGEYFDRVRVTLRVGDLRRLRS